MQRVEFRESEILRNIRSKSLTVYIDAGSGMGKSRLLLSLRNRLKKYSFVIFCSFRHFVDKLQIRVRSEDCSKADIISVILEILECKDDCARFLAEKWLKRKGDDVTKIELQLDGLDEVPRGNLKLALKAWEIIEQDFDSIRLWISSVKSFPSRRTRYPTAYCSICPFSYNDKRMFFEQSWCSKYPDLTKAQLTNIVEKFFTEVFKFNNDVLMPGNFTDYPLNCSILAELYEDKLTESTPFKGNAIDLYDAIYKKKFSIMYKNKHGSVLDENCCDFKLLRENYLQLHTYMALQHLFFEVSHKLVEPVAMRFLNKRDYCKMGIIRDSCPLTFLHLAYADYFVARYIITVLETEKLDSLCSKEIFDNLLYFGTPDESRESFRSSTWLFVEKYLEERTDWSTLNWLKTHGKLKHPFLMKNKVSQFLIDALESKMWNLTKFLISVWVDEQSTAVCNQILSVTLKCRPPLNYFISLCQQLCFDNQCDLIMFSVEKGYYDIARYLLEEKCEDDIFDKIAEMRKNGGGILHSIVDLITNTEHYPVEINLDTFAKDTIDFIWFVHGKSAKEINRRDRNGCYFLLALPLLQNSKQFLISSEYIFSIKEFLKIELNADVNELSFGEEKSVLCMELDLGYEQEWSYATATFVFSVKEEFDLKNEKIYNKTLTLLMSRKFAHINLKSKGGGLTPLQEAVCFFGPILRKDTLEIFRGSGANFNELFGEDDTILHYCVKKFDDVEFIKLLVEYGSKINVQNGEKLCALCLAEKLGKVGMKNYFREKLGFSGEQICDLNCIITLEHEQGKAE